MSYGRARYLIYRLPSKIVFYPDRTALPAVRVRGSGGASPRGEILTFPHRHSHYSKGLPLWCFNIVGRRSSRARIGILR